MKRLTIVLTLIFIFSLALLLNMNIITKQCIDYKCHEDTVPLYLKTLDFFDRHYNYKQLIKKIIKDARSDQERIMKILVWTVTNIRKAPQGFPLIDDHTWHIIIRGYGARDQFQDVFTTLCNYSRVNAFFVTLKIKDGMNKSLSFVKLKDDWSIFDAYYGVYFKNSEGEIASIKDLSSGDWQAFSVSDELEIPDDYREFFKNIESIDYQRQVLSRPSIQSPVNRFKFWWKNRK